MSTLRATGLSTRKGFGPFGRASHGSYSAPAPAASLVALTWAVVLCLLVSTSCAVERRHHWRVTYDWVNPDGVFRYAYSIVDLHTGVAHTPGPQVVVDEGDTLVVNVTNGLPAESISIHWHGLTQRRSPWMDGTSGITQYPIEPGRSFLFVMPIVQWGTYWYHSHTGTQYSDGLFGALVVRRKEDPVDKRFDVRGERVVLINDWYHRPSSMIDAELKGLLWQSDIHFPDYESGLINGANVFPCSMMQPMPPIWRTAIPGRWCNDTGISHDVTEVERGSNYRLRIINAGSGFTQKFSIDNHTMIVVAVDGGDIKPVEVEEIWVYVAQRYDVIVRATMPVDNYWIRGRTFREADGFVGEVRGILRIQVICSRREWVCRVDGESFAMPPRPALLSSFEGKDPSMGNPRTRYVSVELGAVVDLVINNIGVQQHPMHLHGNHFWMLGSGPGVFNRATDYAKLNTRDPVMRDTVQVRNEGWAVFRFVADNPGTWALHCHIEWHLAAGMLMFFEIGRGRIPPPPDDFPLLTTYGRCKPGEAHALLVG